MKKTINVLLVEDNGYYNKLISRALMEKIRTIRMKWDFKFVFHSFTEAAKCSLKVKSIGFESSDSIAFIDYYLGTDTNGAQVIKMLKEQSFLSTIVLMSQSIVAKEETYAGSYDYFIQKDQYTPALCCLYLEQYVDSKFYLPLD
jgi:hypothetical protein